MNHWGVWRDGVTGNRYQGVSVDNHFASTSANGHIVVNYPDGSAYAGVMHNGGPRGVDTRPLAWQSLWVQHARTKYPVAWCPCAEPCCVFVAFPGKRHYWGNLLFSDGSEYQGGWMFDKPHGAGMLVQVRSQHPPPLHERHLHATVVPLPFPSQHLTHAHSLRYVCAFHGILAE